MNRTYRTRHATEIPGWGPAPGWGQPLSGWTPLVDHGPLPVRVAGSMARWWWPTLALTGFGAVVGFMVGHDHPDPGLSQQGLLVIALAAAVVVLLTVHRSTGPGALARATAEYAVVALLAALLTLAGGNQPPATPTAKGESKHAATARAEASQDRPWVLQAVAGAIRAVTKGVQAVTGAAGWLADLWRQAEAKTDQPSPPSSTTTSKGEAIAPSPTLASTSTRRST